MPKNELERVIDRAIKSYIVSKTRNQSTRLGKLKSVDLAATFPGYYRKMPNGHCFFVGATADDVLEEYLAPKGHEQGSKEWYRLAEIVIELGELKYRGP
jgi:hypothetical protein